VYIPVKNAHILFALISISLFVLRSYWSVIESPKLSKRWVKIAPHLNDTLLLGCAIYLMILTQQFPFTDAWLTAKLIALLAYIGLGTMAIKRGKTALLRLVFAICSVSVFAYIFMVAVSRSPIL